MYWLRVRILTAVTTTDFTQRICTPSHPVLRSRHNISRRAPVYMVKRKEKEAYFVSAQSLLCVLCGVFAC